MNVNKSARLKLCVLYLVKTVHTTDEIGQPIETYTKTKRYGYMSSVNSEEWFAANKTDRIAAYRFQIQDYEYNGEDIVEYEGTRYYIYRTYMSKNGLFELYCEEKGGVTDGKEI